MRRYFVNRSQLVASHHATAGRLSAIFFLLAAAPDLTAQTLAPPRLEQPNLWLLSGCFSVIDGSTPQASDIGKYRISISACPSKNGPQSVSRTFLVDRSSVIKICDAAKRSECSPIGPAASTANFEISESFNCVKGLHDGDYRASYTHPFAASMSAKVLAKFSKGKLVGTSQHYGTDGRLCREHQYAEGQLDGITRLATFNKPASEGTAAEVSNKLVEIKPAPKRTPQRTVSYSKGYGSLYMLSLLGGSRGYDVAGDFLFGPRTSSDATVVTGLLARAGINGDDGPYIGAGVGKSALYLVSLMGNVLLTRTKNGQTHLNIEVGGGVAFFLAKLQYNYDLNNKSHGSSLGLTLLLPAN